MKKETKSTILFLVYLALGIVVLYSALLLDSEKRFQALVGVLGFFWVVISILFSRINDLEEQIKTLKSDGTSNSMHQPSAEKDGNR